MNAVDAIKKIMQRKEISNASLGKRLGCSNGAIYERLTQQNISIKVLSQMLSAMDYELIAQPKALGRRPDGCFLVDNSPREIEKEDEEK